MNILVFSEAAWDDKNSFGNTVSNFFCGDTWKRDRFCNFYARKQVPDNNIRASYYNLSALDIVKGILKGHIEGYSFTTDSICDAGAESFANNQERHNIDKLHQKKNSFIYFAHEQIWRSRFWLNQSFKQFISKNAPDILFAFATSPYILWPLIQFLKTHTHCKVVLLVADDVYGSYAHCAFYRRGYLKRELKKCIQAADKLYGISDEMSALYEGRFRTPVATLYKGCDLSMQPKQYLNQPLRLVYAGNLLWGRDDTLALVADALEQVNQDGVKAVLEIYTGTTITEQIQQKLNRGNSSRIIGSRPYEEIKQIMHEADITLHVESFEEKAIETVRYSFSTKIIDCLQSGSQVLGIGPAGIASIEYLKKVDGVVVIDKEKQIRNAIIQLLQRGQLMEDAHKTRRYALQKHELNAVQKKLRDEFENLLSAKKLCKFVCTGSRRIL